MPLPDPNADTTSSKYNMQIGQAQGPVIGDNVHVEQHFYSIPSEPQVDLTAAEAIYRQKAVDAYKWLNFSGFDSPDLSLTNVPLEEIFVRLTLIVDKVIREPIPSEKPSRSERRESRQQERVVTVQESIELGQALSNDLLIVGEPGAGKSTLLRWLAVTFAQKRQREHNRVGPSADVDRLPVLVELGHLPDFDASPVHAGLQPASDKPLEYLAAQLGFISVAPGCDPIIMARRTPGREASGAPKIFGKIEILLLEYLFGLCCALFPTIEKYLVMFAWGWVRRLTPTKIMAIEVEILGDSRS